MTYRFVLAAGPYAITDRDLPVRREARSNFQHFLLRHVLPLTTLVLELRYIFADVGRHPSSIQSVSHSFQSRSQSHAQTTAHTLYPQNRSTSRICLDPNTRCSLSPLLKPIASSSPTQRESGVSIQCPRKTLLRPVRF